MSMRLQKFRFIAGICLTGAVLTYCLIIASGTALDYSYF